MDNQFFTGIFPSLTPHLIIVFGIVIAALWNLFFPKKTIITPIASALTLITASLTYIFQLSMPKQELFARLYSADKLSIAVGLISCIVGTIVVLMTTGYERKFGPNKGEYYTILLTAILSVMFLSGTTDLIMLFVSLETLTICCVLMSGMCKRDRRSNEASLKYLLSTAATTATFMYGMSYIYGMTGSTNFYDIQAKFYPASQSMDFVSVMLMVLFISVIGFKLSMVPFHMWTPDVYEGAPTPVTAFLSVGSKLGGLVVALRLLITVFGSASVYWIPLMALLAILSMIAGNFIALAQTSVKRVLAYSSIAHVGYFLIALCANNILSLSSMLFYIIVYGFMNLGAFTAAIIIENELGSDNMNDWAGLIRKRPWVSLAMALCLINLAGLPLPPAGFLAKFFVFGSGIQMSNPLGYILVITGLLTSIPAVFYYSRIAIKMIVQEPCAKVAALPQSRLRLADSQLGPILALSISVAGIIATSVVVNPLMEFSGKAIMALSQPTVIGMNNDNNNSPQITH